MTDRATKFLVAALVVACVLGVVAGVFAGRGCSRAPGAVEATGIDAAPVDLVIGGRLDASVQADEAAIRVVEDRNARALEQFNEQQQAEYAQVRRQGRQAVAQWLSDFDTRMKTDAGITPL